MLRPGAVGTWGIGRQDPELDPSGQKSLWVSEESNRTCTDFDGQTYCTIGRLWKGGRISRDTKFGPAAWKRLLTDSEDA